MKNILPNVIIGGAPKSGTSSLFFWLKAHPDVCGSRVKETFYFYDRVHPQFNRQANFIEHRLDNYSQFWNHHKGEKIIVEASAPYIYQDIALQNIALLESNPKIIFILRDPADRLYSLFKFNKYRHGLYPESFSFEDFIQRQHDMKDRRSQYEESKYILYIEKWIDRYGLDRVKVYQFEKLLKDKVGFMKNIAEELSIDPGFYDGYDFVQRNETRSMKFHRLHKLGLKVQPYFPQKVQEKLILPLYLKMNSSKAPKKTNDEIILINQLKTEFAPFNERLNEVYSGVKF